MQLEASLLDVGSLLSLSWPGVLEMAGVVLGGFCADGPPGR